MGHYFYNFCKKTPFLFLNKHNVKHLFEATYYFKIN